MSEYLPNLDITPEVEKLLKEKKIYFTFAYAGELRCYKHNQLIWYACAPCWKNEFGGYSFDMDSLVEKGNEYIELFIKNGYIPSQD